MVRFYFSVAVVLCLLGCSEPRVDLHFVRNASSPIKSEDVTPTPCGRCAEYSWVAHDGTSIDLEVERDPYLSIPTQRLSEAEIVHGRWLYRPYCDAFVLSFRFDISVEEMTQVIEKIRDSPTVAIFDGRVLDAGRHIFNGETLTFSFIDRQRAMDTADLIGASPRFREEDDSWRAEVREQQLAILDELLDSPEQLRRLAEEHGVQVEDFHRADLAEQLFCP